MGDNSAAVLPGHVPPGEAQRRAVAPSAQLAEARQRLPLNVLSKLIWLAANLIVDMWYTPFLIAHLGVAVYGLVPLATSMTSYLTVLTTGLDDAIGRFLTIDLARGDKNAANRTFNTALVGSVIAVAILVPIALLISWFAPRIFNMPLGLERDAQWLVLLAGVAFLLTAFTTSFAVPSYAYHRFDLRLLVNILGVAARMGSLVLLFRVFSPQLWQVGVGLFLSALLYFLGHGVLWRRLTPELAVRLKQFDPSLLKQMLEFSGWVLVNMMGAMLFLRVDLIIANLIFGPEVAGRYGSVLIFPSALRALVSAVNGVFVPIVFALYARKSFSRLVRFSQLSVRLMGFAVALPIGLLCGLAKPALTVWLGPEFSDLSGLVVVLVGHLCISLAVVPLGSLQTATCKVRTPGIVSLLAGCASALLAVALALWSGWGYIGIAAAGAIMLVAKNGLFTPVYIARIMKLPWWTFLPNIAASVIGTLTVGVGTYLISLHWTLTSWTQLAVVGLVTSGVYMGAVFLFGLSARDRSLLKSEIERRINRA